MRFNSTEGCVGSMPGYQRTRIWDEKVLTDQIRASLLSKPDEHIISSSTSNMQVEPCCLVLLDHKYPVIGLISVTVKRSRNAESNTASFTIQNIKTRYSGSNKAKLSANTPVSIYMGYSKKYIQRFEGYIDTTSMSVNGNQSTVTVNCRDGFKGLIEKTISAGMYSGDSDYLGEGDWHYQIGHTREGFETHEPRPWKRSEVLRDICYILGLRDITSNMWIEEIYDVVTGFTTYKRHISYEPQFQFDINEEWDTDIVCNFVEENALDVVAKICQSIFHEVLFDQHGRLVVRPARTAQDDAVFYFKEERDIESLSHSVDDDNVVNSIIIKGQTSTLSAVIYPFAPVAVCDTVTLEKGQDEYGWKMTYPRIVAPENLQSLSHASLYAHTISPNSEPVSSKENNPENKPQYDVRFHFPSFNQPYDKQLCLEATCPIITDEAYMANETNVRTWNFYGELDTAVMYEKQPIMLTDRFSKPILVVCKERSVDDDRISKLPDGTPTGVTPYHPGDPASVDPDAVPVNIPTVFKEQNFSVDSNGNYTYTESDNVPAGTAHYDSVPGTAPDTYLLAGMKPISSLPSSAAGQIPSGLSASDFAGKGFELVEFIVTKGRSPYPSSVPDSVYDTATLSLVVNYMAICKCTKKVTIYDYTVTTTTPGTPPVTTVTHYYVVEDPVIQSAFDSITVMPSNTDPASLYSNCSVSYSIGGIEFSYPNPLGGHSLTDYAALPSDAVKAGVASVVTLTYPMVYYETGAGATGSLSTWHVSPVSSTLLEALNATKNSHGKNLHVFTSVVDSTYVTSSNPDCNVVFWKWMGAFKKPTTDSKNYKWDGGVEVPSSLNPDFGRDAEGMPRVQITRAEFYKLAADPHTIVIECVTAGIDHKSWCEVIELDENRIICKGHNLYGSMHDAYHDMIEKIKTWLEIIGAALIAISICMMIQSTALATMASAFGALFCVGWATLITGPAQAIAGAAAGTSAGGAGSLDSFINIVTIAALLAAGIYAFIKAASLDSDIGSNISKVMEDMSCRITGVRKPEIELYEAAACQAAQWWLLDASGARTGETMELEHFTYTEGTDVNPIYQQGLQKDYSYTGMERDRSWVFIIDVTKNGPGFGGTSAPTMFPNGAMITSFGWETPEIGDRNPIVYYTGIDYRGNPVGGGKRKEIKVRYALEAFGDDPLDSSYDAMTLLRLRFENHSINGNPPLHPGTNEIWYNSKGYEVLIDRSMNPVAISDAGIWEDFFEKRDDFQDRRYKYLALVIYSWEESYYPVGSSVTPTSSSDLVKTSSADPSIIFCHARWGLYIPRGLNRGWYDKFRWFERTTSTGSPNVEQNYLYSDIIFSGQERLIANLMNNFKYSTLYAEIRVWGKAFGQYAPTLVYYHETNQTSIGTYGERQIVLENNCINDFNVARRLATLLTAQSNESFEMNTTGKPYIFEGDVVMVKEENSGAIAGVFRNWENIWKAPDMKTTVQPSNKLMTVSIPGVYLPRCATPTVGNNVLVACGHPSNASFPLYLLEVDKACNPIWYMLGVSPEEPTFILRWEGIGGAYTASASTYTIVGLMTGDILKFDYRVAKQVARYVLPGEAPLCGNMDEEQVTMFVGGSSNVYCIDLDTFTTKFITPGGATGIACAIWQTYDSGVEDYKYSDYGLVFIANSSGITCRKMYSNKDRTAMGPVLAKLSPGTFGIPFTNPGTLEYDKNLGELIYLNKASTTQSASIWGIKVDVNFDPAFPDIPMSVEFTHVSWVVDYMEDADLKASFPNPTARRTYINKFFKPNHAIYDVNRDLLITDSANNRVYKMNPSGKFYVTAVTDQVDFSDSATVYKQSYEMVTVASAGSLQLTNFGKNFLSSKTEEQIEAAASTAMARVIASLPREKFVVKLLTSSTIMEAVNNSGELLRVNDTVLVVTGYNGDSSGVGSIIAKRALNDWNTETGEPYTYTDATSIDVTKYGQLLDSGSNNGGGSSVDLSVYNARIRALENNVRTLAGLHGITV